MGYLGGYLDSVMMFVSLYGLIGFYLVKIFKSIPENERNNRSRIIDLLVCLTYRLLYRRVAHTVVLGSVKAHSKNTSVLVDQ